MTALPGQTLVKTNLFGSLALYRDDEKHTYALRVNGVRLATVVATTLLIVYVLGVSAGYFWLRNVRKIDQVALSDVALFRIGNLHHEMAVQQFAKAQASLAAG
ncbi:MAG: hypothetical protein ABSE59_01615, partial [Opitutaceae bacterium]